MKSAFHPARQALVAVVSTFTLLSLPAVAQTQSGDMPPRLEKIDEIENPAAVPAGSAHANQRDGRQIIEKRERGQVTSIEVRSGDNSYYIDPDEQPGTVVPGDAQSGNTRAPQWKIFEFDLKRPAEPSNAETQRAPAAPPTPVK